MPYSARVCSVLLCVISLLTISVPVIHSEDCVDSELPLLCHGARLTRSVVNMRPLKLMDGMEIVHIHSKTNGNDDDGAADGTKSRSTTGYAYADRVLHYLQSHEIKINLHEVLQKSGATDAMARAMKEIESENEVVGKWNTETKGKYIKFISFNELQPQIILYNK